MYSKKFRRGKKIFKTYLHIFYFRHHISLVWTTPLLFLIMQVYLVINPLSFYLPDKVSFWSLLNIFFRYRILAWQFFFFYYFKDVIQCPDLHYFQWGCHSNLYYCSSVNNVPFPLATFKIFNLSVFQQSDVPRYNLISIYLWGLFNLSNL